QTKEMFSFFSCLTGDDGSTCIPITSNNVEIVASQDSGINSKARGSNKVKIQPVAKYDWEHKYYYGRLIAVSNSFLAYAIRGANNHAMIRVLSLDFSERSLLKGFTGAVTDLAFAHLDSSLLGCVDEAGNLVVWQLTLTGSKILYPDIRKEQKMPYVFMNYGLMEDVRSPVFSSVTTTSGRIQSQFLHSLTQTPSYGMCRLDLYSRFVLYVMELRQDLGKGKASFTAVSEFLLTHPVLSFGVRDVTHSRLRHTEVLTAEEESESMSTVFLLSPLEGTQGPAESKSGIQIKLYCVHTKSLQDVQIWFQPNMGFNTSGFLPHSESQDGFDHLTDQSSDKDSGSGSQTDLRKIPSLPAPSDFLSNSGSAGGPMPKLMTPDAFMTPSTSVPASPGSSASSLTIVTAISSNSDSNSPSRGENCSSSLGLSVSTSSPRASSAVLLPGLENLQAVLWQSINGASLPLDVFCERPKVVRTFSVTAQSKEYFWISNDSVCLHFQALAPSGPLVLDSPQVPDSPLLPLLASPTRARSPDVISSASTVMSQDMPEIATQTLQLQRGHGLEALPLPALQTDSMASAACALHLLTSPRAANNNGYEQRFFNGRTSICTSYLYQPVQPICFSSRSLLPLELGGVEGSSIGADSESRLGNKPSLLENTLSQENPGASGGSSDGSVSHTSWPAAPDITRETRNSLRDNGLGD
ncbi:hypothetical protein GOODEAATRI_005906, partial [Goodea atripinnis]